MDFDDFDDILDDLLEDNVDRVEADDESLPKEEINDHPVDDDDDSLDAALDEITPGNQRMTVDAEPSTGTSTNANNTHEEEETSVSADLDQVMETTATTPSKPMSMLDNTVDLMMSSSKNPSQSTPASADSPVISNMDLPKKKAEMIRTTAATPATVSTMESSSPFSSSSSSCSLTTPSKKESTPSRTRATPLMSSLTATRTESPMRKPATKSTKTKKKSSVPNFSSCRPTTTRSTKTTSSSLYRSTTASTRKTTTRKTPTPPRTSSSTRTSNKPMKPTIPLNLGVANRPTKAWLAKQGLLPGQKTEDCSLRPGFKRPGDKLNKVDVKRTKYHHQNIPVSSIPNRPTKAWLAKVAATQAQKEKLETFDKKGRFYNSEAMQTPNGQAFLYQNVGSRTADTTTTRQPWRHH